VIGRLASSATRTPDDSGERSMGNMVADAWDAASGAEAAFVNPGEIRSGLPAGDVTYGRAFASQPFDSSLVSMTLTGAHLLELLKEQWCGRKRQLILQPSDGVSYSWSAATAAAIQSAPCASALNPVSGLQIGGAPVDESRSYRVTVSSLSAGRFNSFDTLQAGVARADGPKDTAAMEAHLAPSLNGDPRVPPETERISVVP
jgi:5'-nucleotidase